MLVSIATAAYNSKTSIAGTIASAQSLVDWEMLVADGVHAILKRRVF
ncbi:MAG: hypothetical protein ACFB13_00250 [Kiloniellaceae bacterium]